MRKNTETMSAATAVVRTLMAQGIDTLYCLPGVQNDDFFDALATIGKAIRPVHTRHEQATAYMALGAALAGMVANLAGLTDPGGVGGVSRAATWLFGVFALAPVLGVFTALRVVRPRLNRPKF